MEGTKLEQAIIDAIEEEVTRENKEEVKRYFENITVNDMIDNVFEW